jgi:hypothetical protein
MKTYNKEEESRRRRGRRRRRRESCTHTKSQSAMELPSILFYLELLVSIFVY